MKRLTLAVFLFLAALPCLAQQVCTRSLSGVNYQTGTMYTFVAADTTRFTNFNNGSGVAATLSSGVTNPVFGACSEFAVWNAGLGEVVITCSGCTINGSPSIRLESLQSADIYGDGQNYVAILGGTLTNQVSYPNSPNGTTCNGLAKVDQTSGGKAVSTAAADELAVLGVVRSGCGTSGNATIVTGGPVQVLFDTSSVNVGDAVGLSPSTAASATDLGSASPTSSAIIIGIITLGPAFSLPSGCTNPPGCWILLQAAGAGGGTGGGSNPNAVVTNPGATQTVTPTVAAATPIVEACNSGAAGSQACKQVNDSGGNAILKANNDDSVTLGKTGAAAQSIGSGTSANTDLVGELTASSNTVSYSFTGSYSSHPVCTASNETATAANSGVKVTYTGTASVTFTTTGASDVVSFHCTARN